MEQIYIKVLILENICYYAEQLFDLSYCTPYVFHQASTRDNKIDRFPNMVHIFRCTAQSAIFFYIKTA
jgi:hypothetical protein